MTSTEHYQINIEKEKLIALGQLPAIVERMGIRRPHECAVRRWSRRGVKGLLLPSVLVGNRLYTSMGALKWWVAATSAVDRDRAQVEAPAAAHPNVRYPVPESTRRFLEDAGLVAPGQPIGHQQA